MRLLCILFLLPVILFGQFGNQKEKPMSWEFKDLVSVPTRYFTPDKSAIEDLINKKSGPYIVAAGVKTNLSFKDFNLSRILSNGDKIYHCKIFSEGSLGYRIQFENLKLDKRAKLWVYNAEQTEFVGSYNQSEILQNGQLLTSTVSGSVAILEYLEPKEVKTSDFTIPYIHHFFRGLKSGNGWGTSGSCMINVACSEADNFIKEQAATCKIVLTGINDGKPFTGWCSGTLMGNTNNDGTPYILTANHCSAYSSVGDLANWEYQFLYQSVSCNTPDNEPTGSIRFRGSSAIAYSGADNGDNSSDFLMVKLTTPLTSVNYDFTFMGWDRSDADFSGGICFHHPDGDIKKVSTTINPIIRTSYGGKVPNSHLKVNWTRTTNGYSVTQGGSSGSGLLNSSKLLIGTLTGGASDCDFAKQSEPDFFGRINKHWNTYGNATNQRLDIWLDPLGGGSATSINTKKMSETLAGVSVVRDLKEFSIALDENKLITNWNQNGYDLKLYNLMGQRINHISTDQKSASMDLSSIPRGVYIIEASKDQYRETKKINW